MTLIAESELAECLVLRGSMTMPAWVGDAARPPGDLDWVVRPPEVVPRDDLDPYPFVDRLSPVQLWPEVVHGAARNEMWEWEEFDTGGHHPRLPPEGLHWISQDELDREYDSGWEQDLARLLERNQRTPDGIEFDPEKIGYQSDWDYDDYDPGGETGRIRLDLPWLSPDGELGEVQVDLSFGEVLPEPAVCTAVPRAGDLPPVGLWTAGRELSLAWKLHWLAADQQTHGMSAMKDLYDAVLLAELDGMHLRPRLRRVAIGAETPGRSLERLLDPAEIRQWTISGPSPGGDDPAAWLSRLADAVPRLL